MHSIVNNLEHSVSAYNIPYVQEDIIREYKSVPTLLDIHDSDLIYVSYADALSKKYLLLLGSTTLEGIVYDITDYNNYTLIIDHNIVYDIKKIAIKSYSIIFNNLQLHILDNILNDLKELYNSFYMLQMIVHIIPNIVLNIENINDIDKLKDYTITYIRITCDASIWDHLILG